MTAWMDGQHIRAIIRGKSRVFWPNGLAVDIQNDRVYWTDGHLKSISYANYDGSDYHVLIRDPSRMPHPYAIAIYKVGLPSHSDMPFVYTDIYFVHTVTCPLFT